MSGVLLYLSAVEQSFKSAGLGWELEKLLPLILWECWLLGNGALGVLGLALRLPAGNLGLLALEGTLVVLVVVQLGVVALYAVEQKVAGLLEERIDGEIERLEVWCERHLGELRVDVQSGEAGREVDFGLLGRCSGELVEVRGEEV